jgi:signal transduction histidine kinase/DNA-binding response OmpR family regulator
VWALTANKTPEAAGRLRILVANAQGDVAYPRAESLRADGHEVTVVLGLSLAAQRASAASYDLAVLDGRWASDGLEGFAALRDAAPEMVWVVTAPAASLPDAVALLRFGVAEILIEPAPPSELQAAVSRAMERAQAQREAARLRALVPLYEVSQAFMLNVNVEDLLQHIVEAAVAATHAQRGSLMLIDPDRQELAVQAAVGMPPEVMATARERVGRGIAGWVARTGVPLVINNEEDIPPFVRSSLRGGMAYSAVCLPLTVKGQVIGVINLTKTIGQPPFTRSDAELLSVLAGQAAIAIDNARLFEEMQQAYEDLRNLDEIKSEFINVAAHELRTPVAVVLGYADLLMDQIPEGGQREYFEAILRSARRLQEIADDLFNLDALRTWRPDTVVAELPATPIYPLVAAVVNEFRGQAQSRNVSLEMSPPLATIAAEQQSQACVRADETNAALILRHLVSNGVKFTPAGGRVIVAVEPAEDEFVIAVADTGPGVPPEKRRYLFQPFFQAESSLTRRHGGMGLGLSIARRLADLLGGRLWLEDRPGFGAVFCLALGRA